MFYDLSKLSPPVLKISQSKKVIPFPFPNQVKLNFLGKNYYSINTPENNCALSLGNYTLLGLSHLNLYVIWVEGDFSASVVLEIQGMSNGWKITIILTPFLDLVV